VIQAVETHYGDCHFRSRIEARWAVFFDSAGLSWHYEPELFDLGSGIHYLPDFYLPTLACYIEVKGAYPTTGELLKAEKLAEQSHHPVFLVHGAIPDSRNPSGAIGFRPYKETGDTAIWHTHYSETNRWTQCATCSAIEYTIDSNAQNVHCDCFDKRNRYGADTPTIMTAYRAARSERFSNG
jgi:hypothetical protein